MWSPDGRRIAYNRADDIAVGPAAPRRRSRLDRIVARDGFWPSWSPESRRLAFLRRGEDGLFRVAVVGVGGGRVRDLVGPGPFELPSWTRSGRHVLYSTNVPGDPDTPRMWRIGASGGRPHSLGRGRFARMSPGGRKIAFVLGDDVWTMNPDGSGRRRIVDHSEGSMSWQLAWSRTDAVSRTSSIRRWTSHSPSCTWWGGTGEAGAWWTCRAGSGYRDGWIGAAAEGYGAEHGRKGPSVCRCALRQQARRA
jgi:Tol biopolymer transport system component